MPSAASAGSRPPSTPSASGRPPPVSRATRSSASSAGAVRRSAAVTWPMPSPAPGSSTCSAAPARTSAASARTSSPRAARSTATRTRSRWAREAPARHLRRPRPRGHQRRDGRRRVRHPHLPDRALQRLRPGQRLRAPGRRRQGGKHHRSRGHTAEDRTGHGRGGLELPRVQGRRELLLGAAVADRRVLPRLPARHLHAAPERTDSGRAQQDDGPARPSPEHAARAVQGPTPAADQRVRHRAGQQRREPQCRHSRRLARPPAAQAGAQHSREPEPDDRRAQHERGRDLRPAREPARGRRPLHRQRGPHRSDLRRALQRSRPELPSARRLPGPVEADDVSSSGASPMRRHR